eukprot:1526929-Karenia_brevis.AAC.1
MCYSFTKQRGLIFRFGNQDSWFPPTCPDVPSPAANSLESKIDGTHPLDLPSPAATCLTLRIGGLQALA